jgi:hypothetical protein
MTTNSKGRVAERVLDELSHTVLAVGQMLDEAYDSPSQFEDWVLEHLPLTVGTAERIRAMWHIHQQRPGHVDLPEPYKALWSLA